MREVAYPHPGEILLEEFLKPMGITQYRLAKEISVSQRRIGEIVAGKRSVTAPIVPGIMPITSFARLARFSDACGAEIPRWIRKKMEAYGDDAESVRAFGLEVVVRLCERLLQLVSVRNVLEPVAPTAPPPQAGETLRVDDSMEDALTRLLRSERGLLPVVDSNGQLVGQVSLAAVRERLRQPAGFGQPA